MVKLLDFGISRATAGEGEFRLTTTGLILGTPYYMSPEQARGDHAVTHHADLYAFGVMLYEMLVGHVPIRGENYNQLMYRVMMAEYPRPRELRPELPPALEQLILQAMELEPSHRPGSAAELEQALLPFCRPTFRDHTIERLSSARLAFQSTGTAQGVPKLALGMTELQQPRRSRLPLVLGGVALVGLAVAAIVLFQGGEPAVEPPPAPVAAASAPVTPPAPPVVVAPKVPRSRPLPPRRRP